jgi:hypothetical protein
MVPTPVATSIILSATSLSFSSIGVTQQLTATVKDQNAANMSGASVTWTTSSSSVATVSSAGLVTAVAAGLSTITATAGTLFASAQVTVLPLSVTYESLPAGFTSTPYTHTLEASGGNGSYEWLMISGALPLGLTLSTGGTISGTPTVTGESTFSVEVRSGDGQAATAQRSITVQAPLQITTTSLPGVLVNSSYDESLAAFGGDSPYTWSVITGSLPNGLSLSPANGEITGTATTVGSSTFTLQVRSVDGLTVSKEFTVSVYAALIITTASVPKAITGNEYSVSFGASGGDGNYTWSLSSGNLPSGLSLSLDGTISGTPTSAGSETFYVKVTSGDGQSETSHFAIDVSDLLEITSTSPLPSGTVGSSYSNKVNATGGGYPYSWSVSSGSLPAGLSLQNYSLDYDRITGTPETAGTSTFTIKVTSEGQTATKQFTITINP